MFIGAFTGFGVARFVNMVAAENYHLSEVNFIAVGMGGVIAGVMHAPMTGMFLIAEITGGYRLFIPLMIVASLSCFISKKITKYNVYKTQIEEHGGSAEPNQTAVLMEKVTIGELVENDFISVSVSDNLRTLLKDVMTSQRNVFPVLDDKGAIKAYSKVRGKKKAVETTVDTMEQCARNGRDYDGKCFVCHSQCPEDARLMIEAVEERFPRLKGHIRLCDIGTIIGSHAGPGTVAVFFYGDERPEMA